MATASGAPTATQTSAVLNSQAKIKAAFGSSPSFFSLGELGGGQSSANARAESSTTSVTTNVNLADLSPSGDLALGLYDGKLVGSGVTSVSLEVTANGAVLLNDANMSAATALATFSDDGFSDLETLGTAGTASLEISLTVQSDSVGSGFYGDFILGDPPAATKPHAHVQAESLISAMASFGAPEGALQARFDALGSDFGAANPMFAARA